MRFWIVHLIIAVGHGLDFGFVYVNVEENTEYNAYELCDGICPPHVIHVTCQREKICYREKCNELTAYGYEHREK